MTVRSSKLVAELVDRVSGPASAIEKSLKNVGTTGRKSIGSNDRANPLGQRGSALLVERVRKLDRETAAFSKRYEVSATKTGKAWSTALTATSAAMATQARTAETSARRIETAHRNVAASAMNAASAITHFRATSRGGVMYRPGLVSRPPLGTSPPLPPLGNANESARNAAGKQRASAWVAAQNAAAAASAARSGGGGSDEGGLTNRRLGGALAGGGTATAAWRLMTSSAEEERAMRQVAVTAGAAESEISPAITRLKALQQKWAVPYAEIKSDFEELIVMGRTWAQALRDIEGLTVARRAYGSGFGRLQTLVGENFDLKTPEQQQRGLQIIAGAGKSGRMEVSDFTRRFPKLAPMFKAAGFKGEKGLLASSSYMKLLADRFGTPDQAAVGMENLLGEFISPATKKRFSKKGVNIDKIVANAEKTGGNGFDAVLAELNRRTGGDERKLGEFFRNKNSLQAISALVTNFAKIPETIAEIEKNAQTAMQDDAMRFVNDSKAKIDGLQNALKDAGGLIGEFLANHLTPFVERIAQGVRVATGKAGSDADQLAFRRKQFETGGLVTRWMASRGISRLEKRLGVGRDFSLANLGNALSPTGIPVANGGAFFDNPMLAKRAGEALQKGLSTNGSPLMHKGGVVTGASLFPGGLSPASMATTPMAAPKVEPQGVSETRNVFDELRQMIDEVDGKTARPTVETNGIERALGLVRELISSLSQVESGAARAANAVENDLSRRIRSSYSDIGMGVSG